MKNKPLLSAIVALIICTAVYWLFWGDRTAIVTTLGGEVCAVKSVGDTVKEGDALLRVKTSLGNAVAARATVNGEMEDGEEAYPLDSVDDLYWFADKVNNDNDNYGDANAFLTKDITVNSGVLDENGELYSDTSNFKAWINCDSQWYQGTFDGAGYTISGLYSNDSSAAYVGLFGLNIGTIKNVSVTDSYFCGNEYVGGVCGYCKGTIENCSNTGKVEGYYYAGGICGFNVTNSTIQNCYNTGAVEGYEYAGGISGNNGEKVKNCYNTGAVSGTENVGGICGYSKEGKTIQSCYYLNTTAEKGIGDGTGSAEAKSAEQFASGEVAYKLGEAFYQTLGEDDLPVLDSNHKTVYRTSPCVSYSNTKDKAHSLESYAKVDATCITDGHEAYWYCENCKMYFSDEACTDSDIITDISAWQSDETQGFIPHLTHNLENGICTLCGVYEPAKAVKDIKDIDGDGHTDDDVYEISNAGQLYWFAGLVNGTLEGVAKNHSANAYLANDITVNENLLTDLINVNKDDGTATVNEDKTVSVWTPIGTDDYSGTFDGAGHTVSGLYFNNSDANRVGLFGYVCLGSNSKIMNLTVADSYFCGKEKVGGICGIDYYVTIQNCANTGIVKGENYAGGVCGYIFNRVIENCYNTGRVWGDSDIGGICGYSCEKNIIRNCFNTGEVNGNERVGGICGKADYIGSKVPIMIINCYNTGAVTGTEYFGSICGVGYKGAVVNCYYLKSDGISGKGNGSDSQGSIEVKSAEQFASGEVCWLLNSGETQAETPVFFQTLGEDDFPVFNSEHHTVVYDETSQPQYYNEHVYEDGICSICGKFENGIGTNLAGHSLTLDGSIGVNFYMELDNSVIADEDAYMHFVLANGETQDMKVSQADKKNRNGKTYYVFRCSVAAKEMTDTITAQMFSCEKQSELYKYTVKEYADYLFANAYEDDGTTVQNQEYADAYELIEAMVNYGSYSQIYFDYHTEALANAGITNTDVSGITAETVDKLYDSSTENLPEGITLEGATLELESETVLNLFFSNTTGKALTFTTDNDVILTQKKSGDYVKVTITNIAAQDLDDDTTVYISVADDDESYSVQYSPMNYCYNVLSKETTETRTDSLKDVMRAFYIYNVKADDYFKNE